MTELSQKISSPESDDLLGALLKHVSRSFYLTIRVLPENLRQPIGLAYLLARAADTIADTAILPPESRLDLLLGFRAHVNGLSHDATLGRIERALSSEQSDPHERRLLQSLAPALALLEQLPAWERSEVSTVVTTLTQGMELDLRTFPAENSGQIVALKNLDELEIYTYLVAGCVGQFWTRLTKTHTPALRDWDEVEMSRLGIGFGKALQYTNVLRDCPKDLRIGRCYFPKELLDAEHLSADQLLDFKAFSKPEMAQKAQRIQHLLLRQASLHYREAQAYLLAIPPQCGRLRLACLWPILIGLETLQKWAENPAWLDPNQRIKVPRSFVYWNMILSLPVVGSDVIVRGWLDAGIKTIEQKIQ